ncbi:MAG: DNA polymerase III subunit gamma/tau C-terminal domain-containing protein, partial [Pseudohongiellaceae bacterium]
PLAGDARAGLEMTLLRMLAFTPEGVPASPTVPLQAHNGQETTVEKPSTDKGQLKKKHSKSIASAQDMGERSGEPRQSGTPGARDAASSIATPARVSAAHQVQAGQAEAVQLAVEPDADEAPVTAEHLGAGTSIEMQAAEAMAVEALAVQSPASGLDKTETESSEPAETGQEGKIERITLAQLNAENWIMLFLQLPLSGITRNIAANCVLKSVSGDGLELLLEESQASVFNDEQKRRIQLALSEYFERDLSLVMETGNITSETPAAWRERKRQERLAQAIETFENDANVQEILTRFSGTIIPDSIQPLSPNSRNSRGST